MDGCLVLNQILFPTSGVVNMVVDQLYDTCPARVLNLVSYVDIDGLSNFYYLIKVVAFLV